MKIGWALDMIGWACAQPFPTLATPLTDHGLPFQMHTKEIIVKLCGAIAWLQY